MSCADNIFRLYAGEITTKRITVIEPKDKISDPDVPVDLTGSVVVVTCKTSTAQSNEEAVVHVTQDTHTDAANGVTDLDFDLTSVTDRLRDEGGFVTCDVWIIDSTGKRLPQGVFEGEVIASPTKTEDLVNPVQPAPDAIPIDPVPGSSAMWQSDGTTVGDDGDLMVKITDSSGETITRTLVDYDSGYDTGYEFTGGFTDRTTGQSGANDLGSNTQYTAAMAAAGSWYRFGFDRARQVANDVAYFPVGGFKNFDQTKGLFGGVHMPEGISDLVDYDFDDSGESGSYSDAATSGNLQYTSATGSYDLTQCSVGDLVKVRFSFNAVPQVANSTLEVGLIFMTRDANDDPTFTFALTTQPVFYGTGSQGVAYLNRVEMSAYIASDEDRNARLLPAIRCNNEILIQPLTTLISIIR